MPTKDSYKDFEKLRAQIEQKKANYLVLQRSLLR